MISNIKNKYKLDGNQFAILLVMAVYLIVFLEQILAIIYINKGVFVYTLDDPYIHLSLARQLATGHYGINPGEFSAPSSSILWPFLLVPFIWLGIDYYAPLFINLAASIITLIIINRIITSHLTVSEIKGRYTRTDEQGASWSIGVQ